MDAFERRVRDDPRSFGALAATHGILMRAQDVGSESRSMLWRATMLALRPTVYSTESVALIEDIQQDVNALYVAISISESFMERVLSPIIAVDEFTAKLWSIHTRIIQSKHKYRHKHAFNLIRADYMLKQGAQPSFKQVEVNTSSCSYAMLNARVIKAHKEIARYEHIKSADTCKYPLHNEIREENVVQSVGSLFEAAKDQYERDFNVKNTAILFVIYEDEQNSVDHYMIISEIIDRELAVVYQITLDKVEEQCTIDDKTGALYFRTSLDEPAQEISLIYFRSGYSPQTCATEKHWRGRYLLETTRAMKGPPVLMQLAGCKKVQQMLASDETTIDKFKNQLTPKMTSTFAKMYPMDNSDAGKEAKKLAVEHPERFVLKPQREGGGNNIFGTSISTFLQSQSQQELSQYILMELIDSVHEQNLLMMNEEIVSTSVTSEIGIYGSVIYSTESGQITKNERIGYNNRIKSVDVNEAGVYAGSGALGSIAILKNSGNDWIRTLSSVFPR